MKLLWPGFLYLWGLIPIIVGLYIWMLKRRKRYAVRYSSLSLVRDAVPRQSWWRRHLPFLMILLALASLSFASSRPVSIVGLPTNQTTIVLAMDVSRSMCATDIAPSRFEAAQAAALSFIQSRDTGTQIGIVAFSGFAEIVMAPTTDQEMLETAIESLLTGRRTAIGRAILKSLDAIAQVDLNVAPSVTDPNSQLAPLPVPEGAYVPDIIVLLTDGASNSGIDPLEAAQQAVDRGVRVYTIGFGTVEGSSFRNCSPQIEGSEPFGFGGSIGGGSFGGGGFRRGIDEETLRQVAEMTGGLYYSAESASELDQVFKALPTYLIMKYETTEISSIFVGIGAFLLIIALLLSMLWHPVF